MMIKFALRTLFFLAASLLTACDKDEDSIFSQVSMRFIMPDNRPVEQLEVIQRNEEGAQVSYIKDVNFPDLDTKEGVDFPDVDANRRATIRLRKGVYTLFVEIRVAYASGEVAILRNTDYNEAAKAITWIKDHESIVLLLQAQ